MLFRFIPAFFILIGIALLFCHPSPFREPEYLQHRNRFLLDCKNKYANLWAFGDFDANRDNDSAYVAVSRFENDSPKVFVRFNHLIPSIELPKNFTRVLHFESVNDIDGNGSSEIYFVAKEEQSCSAQGFLYTMRNNKWQLIQELKQNGCCGFDAMNYVTQVSEKRYNISYKSVGSDYNSSREGIMP